jgi:hypothetical protein
VLIKFQEPIIRIRTQNEMVSDLQMGFVWPASLKLREVFRYARLLREENPSAGGKVFEGEGGTAANEDLDADRDPFNIHTLFQQAGRQGA